MLLALLQFVGQNLPKMTVRMDIAVEVGVLNLVKSCLHHLRMMTGLRFPAVAMIQMTNMVSWRLPLVRTMSGWRRFVYR